MIAQSGATALQCFVTVLIAVLAIISGFSAVGSVVAYGLAVLLNVRAKADVDYAAVTLNGAAVCGLFGLAVAALVYVFPGPTLGASCV
jgi:hypothetical protein